MRIKVSGVDGLIPNVNRRYAEYRFFTSVAPHAMKVRAVDVVIRCDSASRRSFICAAVVDLGSSGRIKTQARAAHPSAAIDRAADRTARLVRRRLGEGFSLKSPAFSS
jgi:ribosome-associated translation inhibitor RaiA